MAIMKRIGNASTGPRVVVLGACLALLGACVGTELAGVRDMSPEGSAFNDNLYGGYVQLSEAERAEYDYWDSDNFALKAGDAARDGAVPPAVLSEWRIPAAHAEQLEKARARLVNALDAGARETTPETAARAQLMFDCWVQEQEEGHQPDDIARCRNGFFYSISTVEVALRPPEPMPERKAEPAPEPEPAPASEPEPLPNYYVVYFDFDSVALTRAAMVTLEEAAASAEELRPGKILVVGHTDLAGSQNYNMDLGERRARAAAAYLIEQGAGRFVIQAESAGESQPSAKTNDNVRDGRNRRVEVILSE